MSVNHLYRCPLAGCAVPELEVTARGLACRSGHEYSYAPGTDVPVFARKVIPEPEYARTDAAQVHDNVLKWMFATFRTGEKGFRERLVAELQLSAGKRVLVTGAGAGDDLPYIARALGGEGEIHAQDIAPAMLLAGRDRHMALQTPQLRFHYSIADATSLPFADASFDAAYHFGGLNVFSDIRKGLEEMTRVVRVGGRVMVGDEGVAPWLVSTEYGQMLARNNPLYASELPLHLLPPSASDVRVRWELGNSFYVISYERAAGTPVIDPDVTHVGTRGGSMRTRFYGQLEGVAPELRDRLYEMASRRGVSRVQLLSELLSEGLDQQQDG